MDVAVKICGLTRRTDLGAAVEAGARYVGFVFFPKSPRDVTIQTARGLAMETPPGVAKVALTVDADNTLLDAITAEVPLDMLQLHGHETPDRVREVQTRYRLPVMKAVGLAVSDDLPQIDRYAQVADQILVDAKPVPGADLPGGNGLTFDWELLARRKFWTAPWMLAGGLTAGNVAEAIARTGATQVDVSSGVEAAPGEKDADKIRAFIAAAMQDTDPQPPHLG